MKRVSNEEAESGRELVEDDGCMDEMVRDVEVREMAWVTRCLSFAWNGLLHRVTIPDGT